jgi:hypothetical protein
MESEAGGNRETLMLVRCLVCLILELPYDAGELVAIGVVECRADIYNMSTLAHLYIDDDEDQDNGEEDNEEEDNERRTTTS